MLTDYFAPDAGGGVERVVYHLAQELQRRGVEVAVLTLSTGIAPPSEERNGLLVYQVRARSLTSVLGLQSAIAPGLYRRALEIAARFRPDILHTHNIFFMVSAVAPLIARRLGIPLVTTMHLGSLSALRGVRGSAARFYEGTIGRWIVQRSQPVLAVSEAVRRHGLSLGVPPSRIFTVPNAVTLPPSGSTVAPSADGLPRVQFVGRLIVNKGPHVFVEAAMNVLSHCPDVRFLLAGDGPMRGRLEALVRRRGWSHRILISGYRADVPDLLSQATLFVRPSLVEGMPLAVLEAMAYGVPVIATPVGGTVDLVRHGETGWLVAPGDSVGLADSIRTLLADTPGRRILATNARHLAQQHADWDDVAQQVLRHYETVRRDGRVQQSA